MENVNEIKKINRLEYIRIISFDNDSEIKDFLKWTKPELLAFYNDWKHNDTYNKDGVYQLTMKSPKHYIRYVVSGILCNIIHQVVSNNGGIDNISQKDILDYITTKRRETLINELLKK